MKLLLENWREYLKEDLLTEFDRSDKEALMDEQDRFTISYEIELESRDAVGDTPGGRTEYARNYLTFDYFADSWNEREASDFWHGYMDEEDPDPLELVEKYLWEEYPTRLVKDAGDISVPNLVRLSIAIKEDERATKEFKTLYNNILKDGTRENKALIALINKDPDIKEALKKRGVQFQTAKQGRLPFDAGVADDEVVLNLEPDVLKEIVHTHLFNPEDVVFFPSAGTDLTIDLTDFLYAAGWEDESSQWIGEADDQIKNFIIDGGTSRYPTIADISYFNRNNWESYHLKAIAGMVESVVQSYIEERSQADWDEYQADPEYYLADMGYNWEQSYEGDDSDGDFYELLEENFPRFMEKWADQLKFEPDQSLRNGIEFSMDNPKFITGLDTAFEFLKDFFFDYNRQDNFQFDHNTGLHTNIGYLDEDGESHKEYNLMKALLFLNHDFAFKEFGERKGTRWAIDLKSDIAEKIEKEFKEDRYLFRSLAMKLYKEDKLDELGYKLSKFVDSYAPSNPKSLGFNIHYIDRLGYVEFRYPGGAGPTLEKMKRATLYYAYVIKQAVDPEYKKKEYQSKLVKLMTNLSSHVDRPTEVKKIKAFMKKDEVYLMPTNVRPVAINSYMQHVLDHSIPYVLYATEAGIFKGIRKGKTLKDTVAVFKVVEGTWDHLDNPSVQMTDRANYKIGERTIPLPELERMITNDSLNFVNSNSTEERIRDVFKMIKAGGRVYPKPPPKKKTSALQEIKVRILK